MNVLFVAGGTGGHVYPALSIAKEFSKKGNHITWIGQKDSLEERICKEEQFVFKTINPKGFLKKSFLQKIVSLYFFVVSLIHSFFIILKLRPSFVVSTGGYTSLAPSLIGALFCPLFIHEQNSIAGLTNRILHKFSKVTFEAFPNTFSNLNHKVMCVGNPLRKEIIDHEFQTKFDDSLFKILILGGSQGSKQINDIQQDILINRNLPSKWSFIHQVGQLESSDLRTAYENAGVKYEIKEFIDDMAEVYDDCDIVISRSGAMSISEICFIGKPSILLPLPWSSNNHQLMNALYLKDRGAAELIDLNKEDSQELFKLLIELEKDHNRREKMASQAVSVFPKDTSENIYKTINESFSI